MWMDRTCLTVASAAPRVSERARVWRPFPEQEADILCVEDGLGDVAPRIHRRFGITLVRSPAFVRVESSSGLIANQNRILLVPQQQLYALRAQSAMAQGPVTLLLEASKLEGLGAPDRAALVSDAQCGAQLAALVLELQRTAGSVESVPISRGVLQSLFARSTPLSCARSGRATRLVAVREYLRAHLDEPVQTAALAAISGLTECHLIRSFHLEFGLPPHAYHLRLRLAAAAELLSNGLSASTVAYECGFADQSHLSRKFKEVYGLTPAAWGTAAARPVARRPVRHSAAPGMSSVVLPNAYSPERVCSGGCS
jgi:AraC-like DNA-binding protein